MFFPTPYSLLPNPNFSQEYDFYANLILDTQRKTIF
jgi:hypothetical protein